MGELTNDQAAALLIFSSMVFLLFLFGLMLLAQRLGWLPPMHPHRHYDERGGRQESREDATDRPVASTATEGVNPIAMRRNDDNLPLSDNELVDAVVVEAEVIARLIRSGRLYVADPKRQGTYKPIGQTELIELAGGVTRNGRPDSPYGLLRAELEQLLNPPPRQIPTHGQVEGSVELPARR